MPGDVLFPKTCPFAWGSAHPSNACFLGPPESVNETASVQPFLHSSRQCRQACRGMPFPSKLPLPMGDLNSHLIRCCMGPSDSASQTASRSDQPFVHSSRQTVPILYNGPPLSQDAPFHGRSGHASNIWFLGPPKSSTQTTSRSVQPFLQASQLWQRDILTSGLVFTARLRPQFRTPPVPNAHSWECPRASIAARRRAAGSVRISGERRAAAAAPLPELPQGQT